MLIACGFSESEPPAPEKAPSLHSDGPIHVVLVTVDTLRADRLSSYGSETVSTPAMDRLAREGIRFTNAATTVPFTLPAHSSIMTGSYPPFHGVRENVGYVLDDRTPTLAERLGDAGWSTAGFVSAFVLDSRWGIARGFDHYFDDFDLREEESANLGSVQRDGAETVAEALSWLDSIPTGPSSEPFFLWLHLFDPHDPYTPPEPFRSRYSGRPYDGEVAYVDSLVGRFVNGLEERRLLDSTLLVLTSDHGEGLGDHGEGFHGFFIYDTTMRVPLIVRLPAGRAGGRAVESAVSHVDLVPTLLAATGQPLGPELQGRSLLPLLLGDEVPEAPERLVYSESLYPLLHYGWAPLRSLRDDRYKFIDAPEPELYDVVSDPAERTNLAYEERAVTRRLKRDLDRMRAEIESAAPAATATAALDPDALRQLQALGYMSGGGVSPEQEDDKERRDPKQGIELHQAVMAAQSEVGAGDLDRAEARLRAALEEDPDLLDAHQMLGTIALRRDEPERALESFRRTLGLAPDNDTALMGLADAYRALGRADDALVGYERILAADPVNTRALLAATDILLEKDRMSEALGHLEAAADSDATRPVVWNRLGELLTLAGRTAEAERALRRAVEGNDEFAQPLYNLAVLAEERGRAREAIRLYENAVERNPDHFQARFNLGRLYGALGDPKRQKEHWQAALESNPDFVRGYFYLAKLHMDRGDLGRAEELARTGLQKDHETPSGALGWYVLADILNRTGRRAEASRAAERGRELENAG